MADVELVIKIPKAEYDLIKKSDNSALADFVSKEAMMFCIKNGTPLACNMSTWVPIKTRPLTEEEKERCSNLGIPMADFAYDCPLPENEQDVLVTDCYGNVELDTFCVDDGSYFENNCDDGDVVAQMLLPKPYKGE